MCKVLVICDDLWHPGEVVEMGLAPLREAGFDFLVVRDAKDILTPEMLEEYAVIMNCKGDQLNSANPNPWFEDGVAEVGPPELRAYIERGGGLLSLHAGNAFPKGGHPGYLDLIGGCFVTHPPRCDMDVRIGAPHPVTEGVGDFTVRDEHYIMDVWAEDITPLFYTVSEAGGRQLGGYARALGAGRVCVLTPGHLLSVWRHPAFRRLVANALRWAAGDA